jgi:glycosyltransferase involved in cell wall biosynthesis
VQLEKLAIKYADQSLTVTETLRRCLGERGADVERITVIPNVCEESFERTFYDSLKGNQFAPNNMFRLVTHGLIEERYGHELVIRALMSLRDNLPEIHYDIIGDGGYRQRLVELVEELKCEDRIHFPGFLPFDDLLHELLKADVGVIGMQRSPYSELIDTNKMYEYIAYRKPVIVPRLRAIEESFDDSCVMFFEPGNHQDLARCIMDLYQNPEKRQYLAENAYRRYEPMCWKKSKKIYLQVVNNLTGKRAG